MSKTVEVQRDTLQRCLDRMRWAGDHIYQQSGGRGHAGHRAEQMLKEAAELASQAELRRPRERPDDPEAMPPGYTREHDAGGYYAVGDPVGNPVEGPANGKFQGKQAAADGAWAHYQAR